MYADDLALVAGSPEELQAMLDIVHNYAQKWRYNLNADKSVVMVFGEASCTRKLARSARKWTLGGEVLKEVDEQHHLGILRTVFNSTIHCTNKRATAGRSTFYALNSVGSRFGRLDGCTFSLHSSSTSLYVYLSSFTDLSYGPSPRRNYSLWNGSTGGF